MPKVELSITKSYTTELESIGFQVRGSDGSVSRYMTDPVGFSQIIAGGVVDGVKKVIALGGLPQETEKSEKMEELLRAVIRGDRNVNQRIREFFIMHDTVSN